MKEIDNYLCWTSPQCPNCPAVKEYLPSIDISGKILDATTEEGLSAAHKHGVTALPTVYFFNKDGEKMAEAHSVADIEKIITKEG